MSKNKSSIKNVTEIDINNFILLLDYFNKQSEKCIILCEYFKSNYGEKFQNKQASIQDVAILIFLIDFICVTRCGNTRLLRTKKDIVGIYNRITDVPMHCTNSEFDLLFNKFSVEITDRIVDENNLYTYCCHTELNYNLPNFTKSKKAKQNKIVKIYDLKESTFNEESDRYIVYLFQLLEDQTHLYKLLNKDKGKRWFANLELSVIFDFENQKLKKKDENNIALVNILTMNRNIVETFFKNGIQSRQEESRQEESRQATKSKAISLPDYPNKKMKPVEESKPVTKSKAVSFQDFPNKRKKNEDIISMDQLEPEFNVAENITSNNEKNADLVNQSNYNDIEGNVIIKNNNHADIIAQIRSELANMDHYIFQVDNNDNKIYYRINFNFDKISEGDLKHLINYVISLVGKYSTNPENIQQITLMLKSIFEQFNIPFSIKMAFTSNNDNKYVSKIKIPNKLLEYIFTIYLKPEEMFKPVEEIAWLKSILIDKSIDELMKFRNTLDVVVKNTHSTDLIEAKLDIESLISNIDSFGIGVLDLNCPCIIGESINIIKIIYGVIITDETYFHRLPNIFHLSEDVDENDKFLKETTVERKENESLNIFNLIDLTTSSKFLTFNSENKSNNNFSLKSSLCLTYKENYQLLNQVDNFHKLIFGTYESLKYLMVNKLNEKLQILNYEKIPAEDISNLIFTKNKRFKDFMSKIVEIEGIFNSSKALIHKASIFYEDLKINNNTNNEKFKMIDLYLIHALYGSPDFQEDRNHLQEEYLFGNTKLDKRYKIISLKFLNNNLLLKDSQKDLLDLYCKGKGIYNFGNSRHLYLYVYKYGILDQLNQIMTVLDRLNIYQEENIKFKEWILKLNGFLKELNKWKELCQDLHKLNFEKIQKLNNIHEEANININEDQEQLIVKCNDLNLQIFYDESINNKNINNDNIDNKNNNDDNDNNISNNNDDDYNVNSNNSYILNNKIKEEISIDEIRSFVNTTIIEFESVQDKPYSFDNNKAIEFQFIDIIHKSYISSENNRNDLIKFIYYYINYHFSDVNFMKDKIDKLGWSEGLNILGLRLIYLIEKTYDAHLVSLLPDECDEKSALVSSRRGDILRTIAKYNQSLNESQLKSEAHAFKTKNTYTVWFTLNRIHDSLCWNYISNLSEKEKLKFPEINKFLEIIQKNFKVTDRKGNNCFEYSIQELYSEGKISTNNNNEYFKKLFHRKKDVNNRMVLTTAIKIIKLKFLEVKNFRYKLEDYSKHVKSEFIKENIVKVIEDITTTNNKPEVTYYNQHLPTKRAKKRAKSNVTTKGYEVDQFVVPDDDESSNIKNKSNKEELSNLKAKFEDPTTSAEDMFKIADAIIVEQKDFVEGKKIIKITNDNDHHYEYNKGTLSNNDFSNNNNKEIIDLIDDDLNEVIYIEKALENLNQSLEVDNVNNKLHPEIDIIKNYMIKDKQAKKLYCEKFIEMKKQIDEKNKEIEVLKQQLNKFNK